MALKVTQYYHYSLVACFCSFALWPLVGALYLSMCYLRPISYFSSKGAKGERDLYHYTEIYTIYNIFNDSNGKVVSFHNIKYAEKQTLRL